VRTLAGPTTDFAFRITHVDVKEGDMVAAGQPLAELDVKVERAANLALAKAQVREAEVASEFAALELSRKENLSAMNSTAISAQELDNAQEAAQLSLAKLETAKRREAYAQVMLDQATIRAPVAGMILRILKHGGEGVSPNQGLIELGQVAHMQAVAEVFETNARFVHPGQKATFKSQALTKPITGTVLRVLPQVEPTSLYSTNAAENIESRIIRVVISLDDSPAVRSLTGLQGTAFIDTAGGS
jgi:HlyD family secretion protein